MKTPISKVFFSLRTYGFSETLRKTQQYVRRRLLSKPKAPLVDMSPSQPAAVTGPQFYPGPVGDMAYTYMPLRVLLVAELSIPQCRKYRVDQKKQILESLGIQSEILSWTEIEKVRSSLQLFPAVIFYRVPAVPDVINLINEAKRLGVITFWEVDDLIIDVDLYKNNSNLQKLSDEVVEDLLSGVALYRKALLICDKSIASTSKLAEIMHSVTGKPAYVVENALDDGTKEAAEKAIRNRQKPSDNQPIVITYGAGTNTHDVDFLSASDALISILEGRKEVILRIIGPLDIGRKFDKFESRIERIPFLSFDKYMEVLHGSTVGIAPLEDTIFNDCKSNIKYIEYSTVGLPSVCSPSEAFSAVIVDGVDGFTAKTTSEWEKKILALIDNAELRRRIGSVAREKVLHRYDPGNIAREQLSPILSPYNLVDKAKRLRLLLVNVFYGPQSFGGATIVAEALASFLASRWGWEVFVFTTWKNESAPEAAFIRYKIKSVNVIGVRLPNHRNRHEEYDNRNVQELFEEVIDAISPNIVSFHSIQDLGATVLESCYARRIPYVVTLHDAWWICERQFMITGRGEYCFQTRINPAVCATCVPSSRYNRLRGTTLKNWLSKADLLVAPSSFFRDLYMANGFDGSRIKVNKNGITAPGPNFERTSHARMRFGYVGGSTNIKGYDLIRAVFSELQRDDVELVMVDNTMNLGYQSVNIDDWNLKVLARVVPAYNQENIDEFFSDIDVLLFPTQCKESFGLTVREALVRDVWVIATDAGGAVEDIVDGENGYIIPLSRDPSYLRDAVQRSISMFQGSRNYTNPYKDRIQTFDSQAEELNGFLRELCAA